MCCVVSTLHLASYPHHAVSAVEEHCPCSGVCCYMFCPHSFQLQTLTTLFQLPRGDVPDEGPSGVVCFGMCCIHADSSCRPSPHSSSCRETLLMFPVRGQECVLSTPLPVEDLHHADPPAERRRMCLVRGPVAWCFVLCCVHTPSSCRLHNAFSAAEGQGPCAWLRGKLCGVLFVLCPHSFQLQTSPCCFQVLRDTISVLAKGESVAWCVRCCGTSHVLAWSVEVLPARRSSYSPGS